MIPEVHEFLGRLKSVFRRQSMEREMADELEFHQAMLREKLERGGVPASDIESAAQRRFGNASRWHERLRELWQFRTLENLLRDICFSWRMLVKSRGFTTVALLTLALGVGANTAVFSLIDGVLLRPLPVPQAEDLAVLRYDDGAAEPNYSFCAPFFRSLETRHEVFSDVFAYNGDILQVRGASGNENVPGMLVSGQFFSALETPPLLGRYLTPEDDTKGGSPEGLAVVISESFWDTWFNRAPDVVGRKMTIANATFTVVGVMPKRFIGADPTQRPEIFAPLSADPIIDAPRDHIDDGIHAWWLTLGARLKPGTTLEQANAQLLTVSRPILHDAGASDADFIAEEEKGHFHFAAEPGSRGFSFLRAYFRRPLVAIFAMCAGILLLACLNLASLLMARGAARERELATRLAMGVTRGRLIQQLLTESLLIALLGTAAGVATAPAAAHALTRFVMGRSDGLNLDTSLDFRVLGFAAGIAASSALLIGLAPALQATSGSLSNQIKDGTHAKSGRERRRILPRLLMATEVALALVLVVGAGLLAASLQRLFHSGIGFDPKGLANITFTMDKQPLTGDALMQLYRRLGDGLSRQPGVKSVSFEFIVPLLRRGWNASYSTPAGGSHLIMMNAVGPEYFATMRIPLRAGREFTWSDTNASGLKMVLNESAAKLLFPGQNAIGQHLVNPRKMSFEVVAVVADAKYREMRAPAPPTGYVPMQQDEEPKPSLTAVIRTDGPTAPLASAARALAAQLAPSIPAPAFSTADEVVNLSMGTERMMAMLAVFFAGCALLVTGIGLYGTLAYATARRTSEIGIRMALGARRAGVMALVFKENAAIAAVGSAAGLAAAMLTSRALASFLYETSPRDPWVLIGSVAALAAIASAASLLPALRASRIEPMAAIRCE